MYAGKDNIDTSYIGTITETNSWSTRRVATKLNTVVRKTYLQLNKAVKNKVSAGHKKHLMF